MKNLSGVAKKKITFLLKAWNLCYVLCKLEVQGPFMHKKKGRNAVLSKNCLGFVFCQLGRVILLFSPVDSLGHFFFIVPDPKK